MTKKAKNLIRSITYDQVQAKIIEIHDQKVILDNNVAELYGVETRAINQAVKRNVIKFPKGYIIELTDIEWNKMRSQIVISPRDNKRSYKPTAFTERGLYMLATILKSPQAVGTTIAIIDTFAKINEIVNELKKYESQDMPCLKIKDLL